MGLLSYNAAKDAFQLPATLEQAASPEEPLLDMGQLWQEAALLSVFALSAVLLLETLPPEELPELSFT